MSGTGRSTTVRFTHYAIQHQIPTDVEGRAQRHMIAYKCRFVKHSIDYCHIMLIGDRISVALRTVLSGHATREPSGTALPVLAPIRQEVICCRHGIRPKPVQECRGAWMDCEQWRCMDKCAYYGWDLIRINHNVH